MCAVSMISGHYQDRFPGVVQFPPQEYPNYLELIRKARLYDELMKQPDCPDPKKEAWMKDLEKYMKDNYDITPNKGLK